MPGILLSLMLLSLSPCLAPPAAEFEMACLGAGGGDFDGDMTSFLFRPAGQRNWSLLVDGGSVGSGIIALEQQNGTDTSSLDPQERIERIAETLRPVEGMLLTHSHLDHVSGFSILGPVFLHLNGQGKKSFRVLASPLTLAQLETHLYAKGIWGNFGHFPKENPVLAWEPIGETGSVEIGGFRVRRQRLNHNVESSAWILESPRGGVYIHCGDTGTLPVEMIDGIRHHLASGRLRGLALETSFPVADEDLAGRTTHLTPESLLCMLAAIAEENLPASPRPWGEETLKELAARVGRKLPMPVVISHIKPLQYRKLKQELDLLQAAGLPFLVVTQGSCYTF